jgi:hypothetical protein
MGVEVQLHTFLILTLDGGDWSASHTGHFIPMETARTHWTEGWVGHRAGLGMMAKRKIMFY